MICGLHHMFRIISCALILICFVYEESDSLKVFSAVNPIFVCKICIDAKEHALLYFNVAAHKEASSVGSLSYAKSLLGTIHTVSLCAIKLLI